MKNVLLFSILFVVLQSVYSAPKNSQCNENETVYFNCNFLRSKKIASLCGSAENGDAKPYLQYRVGVIGEPLELAVPDTITDGKMRETFFFQTSKHRYDDEAFVEVFFRKKNTFYNLTETYRNDTYSYSEISFWYGMPNRDSTGSGVVQCRKEKGYSRMQDRLYRVQDLLEKIHDPGELNFHMNVWDLQHVCSGKTSIEKYDICK
jgi:hypothetical protein